VGYEVAVLDNLSTGRRENIAPSARLFEVDLRDRDSTRQVIEEFRPDVVCHQAAQASVAVSMRDPKLDAEINLIGGLNLLDACTQSKVRVTRVVFASTGGAIYGEVANGQRASETAPALPISPYAVHKLAFEQLLAVYRSERGLDNVVLRYANVYGPRQDPHGEAGVVAIFLNAILAGQGVCVNARDKPGDAGCVRDYVYVSDVAAANLLAVRGALQSGVMNVGTGIETTTLELLQRILELAKVEVPISFAPRRAGDIQRSVLDPTRCAQALGSLVGISDGLQKTYAWHRSQ
jgi:UDP-glucose 4-epimerase